MIRVDLSHRYNKTETHTHTDRHRTTNLELLSELERKAPLSQLLAPLATQVRVADHRVLISMGVETSVEVQPNLLLAGANIHGKTVAEAEALIWLLVS